LDGRNLIRFVAAGAVCVALLSGDTYSSSDFERTVRPFFAKHCYSCHNARGNSGGLNLQEFNSAASVNEYRDEWERILKRISSGQMPPRQAPRPDSAEVDRVCQWIQGELDRTAHDRRN
jgi:mono/diheme cytochrome c family protein